MPGAQALKKKEIYFDKLIKCLEEHTKIMLVTADNVGSKQISNVRVALRGKGTLLMGKNTMIRKCLRDYQETKPEVETLLPLIKGNVGLIFTNGDLTEIRDILAEHRVGAPAKAGSVAPLTVVVPAGPTGMEPTQTSFLQALNIASKIVRGQVEIVNDVTLITKGEKVGTSEAALLQRLDIRPFSYGLEIDSVWDNGTTYDRAVLDLTDDVLLGKFMAGVANLASVSLAIGYPTLASLPHSIANSFKNLLAIALETEYTFDEAEAVKEMLANPGAFAAASGGDSGAGAAEPEPEPEPEEESEEEDLGGGLFGDDDGW